MSADFTWKVGFDLEKESLQSVKQSIEFIKNLATRDDILIKFKNDPKSLQDILKELETFEKTAEKAFNIDINKFDLKKLMSEISKAELSIISLQRGMDALGADGSGSLKILEQRMGYVGLSAKKTNKVIEEMATTFKNTLKWNLASGFLHQLQGAGQRAIGFIKDLDDSLNNIRVVTGSSAKEMELFAKQANDAAKALGQTTTDYTKASLLFFQQGKSAREVEELTKATLIGANITGEEVAETAELLTAALNGYNKEATDAMKIMDKFAAVGASTGSDFNELAIGFSKVASMANMAGVEVDQLNGMLATVSTVTREAPESIGTSFKTVFSRMSDLKADKKDEDGWTTGQVEDALKRINLSLLDSQGNFRDLGKVIDDVGNKWKTMSKEDKLGVSTALAGTRQQNRLIALFNAWDMYTEAVKTSVEAEGSAFEQNMIRMDSMAYKTKQLKAEWEELWMKVVNSDLMKGFTDFLTGAISKANDLVDAFGGIGPILVAVSAMLAKIFSGPLASFGINNIDKIHNLLGDRESDKSKLAGKDMKDVPPEMLEARRGEALVKKYLSAVDQERYVQLQKELDKEYEKQKLIEFELSAEQEKILLKKSEYETEQAFNEQKIKSLEKIAQELEQIKIREEQIEQAEQAAAARQKIIDDNYKATHTKLGNPKKKPGTVTPVPGIVDIPDPLAPSDDLINVIAELTDEDPDSIRQNVKTQKSFSNVYGDQLAGELQSYKNRNGKGKNGLQNLIKKANKELEIADRKAKGDRDKKIDASQTIIDGKNAEVKKLIGEAEKMKKVQMGISGISAAVVGLTGAFAAFQEIKDADGDFEKTLDGWSSAATSAGAALMMIPSPMTQIAGGLILVTSLIGKFVLSNFGMQGVMKKNKELLEKTTKSIMDAKTQLGELNGITTDYNNLQKKMQGGKVNVHDLAAEDMNDYFTISNKIAEVAPELIKYYDEEGNAVLDLTRNINELKDAQKEQIRVGNQAKSANAGNFGKEAAYKLDKANAIIDENEAKLAVIRQGQGAIDKYNSQHVVTDAYTDALNVNMADDLSVKVAEQQKIARDAAQSLKDNVIDPLFNGSEAYSKLNEEQKNYVRGLLTVEKATNLAHNPDALNDYIKTVQKSMLTITREGDAAKASADKFLAFGYAKQQSMLDVLGTLKLEGKAYDDAFEKMTNYYANSNAIGAGPMTTGQIERITGAPKTMSQVDYTSLASYDIGNMDKIADRVKNIRGEMEPLRKELEELMHVNEKTADQKNRLDEVLNTLDKLRESEKGNLEWKKQLNEESILASLSAIDEFKANQQLEKQYWDQIDVIAKTTDGYNELADAFNRQNDAINNMSELMDGNTEASSYSAQEQAAMADALEKYRDTIPGLAQALDDYRNGEKDGFSNLVQYMDDARTGMVNQQGMMYAKLHETDENYYKEFLTLNQEKNKQIFIEYGIRATNYKNLQDYEKALAVATANGKLSAEQQANNEALAMNMDFVNQTADNTLTQVENTATGAKQISTLWKILSDDSLGFWQKIKLGWFYMVDGMTNMIAGFSNAVKGVWNGVLDNIESGINSSIDGFGKLYNSLPESVKKFFGGDKQFGHITLKRAEYGSGTNWAATYAKELSDAKIAASMSQFNYGDQTKKVADKKIKYDPVKEVTTKEPGGKVSTDHDSGSDRDVKNMDYDTDYLHDTNVLLQQQDSLIKQLQNDEEKLYGLNKINNLNKQNEALDKKKKLLEQQLEIINTEGQGIREKLAKQDVLFNEDGTIANYNQLLQKRTDEANIKTNPDEKQAAIDAVKELMETMKQYEDLTLKTKFDKAQAIEEVKKLQRDIYKEKFEFSIGVKLESYENQSKMLEFINGLKTEFEDLSEVYENTSKQLKSATEEIGDLQAHMDEIQSDATLTEKEKVDLLNTYKDKLIAAVNNANKLKEELKDINEKVMKKGLELLDRHLSKFESINNQFEHTLSMMKLLGQTTNYSAMGKIYEAQARNLEAQVDTLLLARGSMAQFLAQQKEGTDEWYSAYEQLNKIDEQLRRMTEDTLKTFSEEFKNSITGILDALDKRLYNGIDPDDVKRRWEKAKKEQEKYLTLQEKIVWAGRLQSKIQQQINESNNPEVRGKLQKFLDEELATLKQKDKLSKYDVERAEQLYEITQNQIALEEARNNKNLTRLVRDSQGNWAYQYVENTEAVREAQEKLSESLEKLMKIDQDQLTSVQDELIDLRDEFRKRVEEIVEKGMSGQYSQDQMYAALEEARSQFIKDIEKLRDEHGDVINNLDDSTEDAVGNIESLLGTTFNDIASRWTDSINMIIRGNSNFQNDVTSAIVNVKAQWQSYQNKVSEVVSKTNETVQELIDKARTLALETEQLQKKTEDVIDKINAEWESVEQLRQSYMDLQESYKKAAEEAQNYIESINSIIEAANKATTAIATMKAAQASASTAPKGGTTTTTTTTVSTSSSTSQLPRASASELYALLNGDLEHDAPIIREYNATHRYKKGGLNTETGWHYLDGTPTEPEIVLNSDDTKNILSSVRITRDYAAMIKRSFGGNPISTSEAKDIQQTVQINADFSGVKSSSEIERAFDNMSNRAAQYAYNRIRQK